MTSTKIPMMENCEQCSLKVHICVVCLFCMYSGRVLFCSCSSLWYCLINVVRLKERDDRAEAQSVLHRGSSQYQIIVLHALQPHAQVVHPRLPGSQ